MFYSICVVLCCSASARCSVFSHRERSLGSVLCSLLLGFEMQIFQLVLCERARVRVRLNSLLAHTQACSADKARARGVVSHPRHEHSYSLMELLSTKEGSSRVL